MARTRSYSPSSILTRPLSFGITLPGRPEVRVSVQHHPAALNLRGDCADEWGAPRWGRQSGDAALEVLPAPDGYVLSAECRICGARREALADLRPSDPVGDPYEDVPVAQRVTAAHRTIDPLLAEHEVCTPPDGLAPAVQAPLYAAAEQAIRARQLGALAPTLHVRFDDGTAMRAPVASRVAPLPPDARPLAALRTFVIRDLARQAGRTVELAVYVAEQTFAPAPGEPPEACVIASTRTADAAWTAIARVAAVRTRQDTVMTVVAGATPFFELTGLCAGRGFAPYAPSALHTVDGDAAAIREWLSGRSGARNPH